MASLVFFEKIINHYLQSDQKLAKQLDELNKKTVAVELSNTNAVFFISIIDNTIALSSNTETHADVTLTGTPFNLARLLISNNNGSMPNTVSINGDIHLAQGLYQLSNQIDLDWENYLSQYIGDVGAHQLGRFVKNAKSWGRRFKESMELNFSEYVTEEKNLVATATELNEFYQQVDDLSMATERLEARINKLL